MVKFIVIPTLVQFVIEKLILVVQRFRYVVIRWKIIDWQISNGDKL